MSDPIRLNVGGGNVPLPGYTTIDRKLGGEAYPLKWSQAGPVYPDGSVDEVRASHVLEHFSHRKTADVVAEWCRVLKPGGVLKIAVPNFDHILAEYSAGSGGPIEGYLMGGHTDADDRHGAIFNEQKLRDLMKAAGLVNVRKWKSEVQDCASLPVSLNLMGTKPDPAVKPLAGVHVVMSMPRLCFTDQSSALMEAAGKLRLPVRIRQGAFWGQSLTVAFEQSIADGAEYILAVDYDTIFTPDDVADLHRLMLAHPEADAICPMQVGRDRDTLLMTVKENGKARVAVPREEMESELFPVSTCHFGLTMLRVATLNRLPKPWFYHHPDADGRWGEGRIDEDIHFWQALERAGGRAFQANGVVVGHMQLVVTWPDTNLAPIHQYVGQYRKDGKPEGVWS